MVVEELFGEVVRATVGTARRGPREVTDGVAAAHTKARVRGVACLPRANNPSMYCIRICGGPGSSEIS